MNTRVELRNSYYKPVIHIVVIEFHHHSELICNLIRVLELESFKISLITVPEVLQQIDRKALDEISQLTVFCKNDNENINSFIESMNSVFESADILYFNTVRHFWSELCNIPIKAPAIIRIHNSHADLAPSSHFYRPMLNFPAIFSHMVRKVWISGEWRNRERFLSQIDYFMFPNQAITDYVSGKGWVNNDRILPPVMPFGFLGNAEVSIDKKINERITIAITGKVDSTRKNYNLVYDALKICINRLHYPVRLVLLGKASGKQASRIIENLKSLESDRFSLEYSNDYISQKKFNDIISEVDFILAPIEVQTRFRKYREIYGKSKMSGIENDILLYRKPSIITSEYIIKGEISKVVKFVEPLPEDLADAIVEWVNKKRYVKLKRNFSEMKAYQPESVAKMFYELCSNLIRK
ncbi:hypothetical protein LL947_00050 [Halomonas sp. BLK-85]